MSGMNTLSKGAIRITKKRRLRTKIEYIETTPRTRIKEPSAEQINQNSNSLNLWPQLVKSFVIVIYFF